MAVAVVAVVAALVALVLLLGGGVALAKIRRVSAQNRLVLSAIVDSSSDAIVSIDREGRVTTWNSAAERLFGYSQAEMVGKAYEMIVPPEELETFRANFRAIRERRGQVTAAETTRVAKDGHRVEVSLSAFSVIGGGATVFGAILRDLTAQRGAENTLRETQRRLQAILDNSPNLIYLKDLEGRFVMVNRQLADLLERPVEDILGKTVHDMYPPEAASSFAEADRVVLESGASFEREERVIFPRGQRVTINSKFPLFGLDGKLEFIGGIATDITARRQAEDDLRELQWQLQGIMENAFTSIHLKDLEGHYLLVNHEQEKLLGHPASEILGRTAHDFLPPETAVSLTAREREVIESGQPAITQEVTLPLPGGDRVILSNKFPLRGRDGTIQYLGGIALDITDRKRTESVLASATAAADAANHAKSEFLSRMSHELRTPLNVVLGFGQLLQLDELRPDQEEAVGHILNAGAHLLDIINDALDISRVESGRVSLSLEPVELAAFCRETTQLLRPLADASGIRIDQPPPQANEPWVTADRQRLKQILLNLISNSIKYNHQGGLVTISWAMTETGALRCAVADTGPGIAPEKHHRVFTPFDRLGAEGTEIEGTGLGLALTRRLVEAMGGAIGFESDAGGGATFWIDLLPAVRPGSVQPEEAIRGISAAPAGPSQPKVIVYIEDSLANVDLMEFLLGRWTNVTVIPAMQGRMGLDLVRQHHPDLVLLDLNLPDLPGEEVLRQLKSDPATSGITVVVASADATPQQIERLMAAGATEYFTKPFNVPRLLEALARELGVKREPTG